MISNASNWLGHKNLLFHINTVVFTFLPVDYRGWENVSSPVFWKHIFWVNTIIK